MDLGALGTLGADATALQQPSWAASCLHPRHCRRVIALRTARFARLRAICIVQLTLLSSAKARSTQLACTDSSE